VKLAIIKEYAAAYSRILSKKGFHHIYIDAFAGAGIHISETTGGFVRGSPLNALITNPSFEELYFVELDGRKVEFLREAIGQQNNVHIYHGNCNDLLPTEVFPKISYKDYKRALCFLDPYGLHLSWKVVEAASQTRSIEIFLNFPIHDINRNVLRKTLQEVEQAQIDRMNTFWGDFSWRDIAYRLTKDIWGKNRWLKDCNNEKITEAFRQRLINVAGFIHVPKPMPMRNSRGSTVFYLFFASHNQVGAKIAQDIFKKYSHMRMRG